VARLAKSDDRAAIVTEFEATLLSKAVQDHAQAFNELQHDQKYVGPKISALPGNLLMKLITRLYEEGRVGVDIGQRIKGRSR
jgi:hypothetical protein